MGFNLNSMDKIQTDFITQLKYPLPEGGITQPDVSCEMVFSLQESAT